MLQKTSHAALIQEDLKPAEQEKIGIGHESPVDEAVPQHEILPRGDQNDAPWSTPNQQRPRGGEPPPPRPPLQHWPGVLTHPMDVLVKFFCACSARASSRCEPAQHTIDAGLICFLPQSTTTIRNTRANSTSRYRTAARTVAMIPARTAFGSCSGNAWTPPTGLEPVSSGSQRSAEQELTDTLEIHCSPVRFNNDEPARSNSRLDSPA